MMINKSHKGISIPVYNSFNFQKGQWFKIQRLNNYKSTTRMLGGVDIFKIGILEINFLFVFCFVLFCF